MQLICHPFPGYVPLVCIGARRGGGGRQLEFILEQSTSLGHILYCFLTLSYHNQLGDKDSKNTSPYVSAIMKHFKV